MQLLAKKTYSDIFRSSLRKSSGFAVPIVVVCSTRASLEVTITAEIFLRSTYGDPANLSVRGPPGARRRWVLALRLESPSEADRTG
jgi:hypothetical protein